MIHFNTLKLSNDNKCLIIEAEIDKDEIYTDITIDNVIIDTQDTYIINGPSSNPVYNYKEDSEKSKLINIPDTNIILSKDEKLIRLYLDNDKLGVPLNNTMFFVYVIAKGIPSAETPCGKDSNQLMGIVVDLKQFYNKAMLYIKELSNRCELPKGFINMYLQWKAIELSIKTCNYVEAIKYWNEFIKNIPIIESKNNCNCYG